MNVSVVFSCHSKCRVVIGSIHCSLAVSDWWVTGHVRCMKSNLLRWSRRVFVYTPFHTAADTLWCDVMWCDVMWCDVMWCDVMWCDVMWCDVMWCDVMFRCCSTKLDVGKFSKLSELRNLKLRGTNGLTLPAFSFTGGLTQLAVLTRLHTLVSLTVTRSNSSILMFYIIMYLTDCYIWLRVYHSVPRRWSTSHAPNCQLEHIKIYAAALFCQNLLVEWL